MLNIYSVYIFAPFIMPLASFGTWGHVCARLRFNTPSPIPHPSFPFPNPKDTKRNQTRIRHRVARRAQHTCQSGHTCSCSRAHCAPSMQHVGRNLGNKAHKMRHRCGDQRLGLQMSLKLRSRFRTPTPACDLRRGEQSLASAPMGTCLHVRNLLCTAVGQECDHVPTPQISHVWNSCSNPKIQTPNPKPQTRNPR